MALKLDDRVHREGDSRHPNLGDASGGKSSERLGGTTVSVLRISLGRLELFDVTFCPSLSLSPRYLVNGFTAEQWVAICVPLY